MNRGGQPKPPQTAICLGLRLAALSFFQLTQAFAFTCFFLDGESLGMSGVGRKYRHAFASWQAAFLLSGYMISFHGVRRRGNTIAHSNCN